MKDYTVTLNYINENKEVVFRCPNIRFLKFKLEQLFKTDKELVHIHFNTKKGSYSKVFHQDWFYSRW